MMSTYQTQNSKLLWMIIGGISVVVVLFLAIQWFLSQKDQQSTSTATQPIAEKTIISKAETTVSPNINTASSAVAAPIQLVEESVVKSPLPSNDSLAKEEIAKLDDIHQQLQDQQRDLKQQNNDVDTLLKLKEDQIKLLEAQISAQHKS